MSIGRSRDFEELEGLSLPWERLRGKTVLLTGGTGFVGRYLTQALCHLNARKGLGLELVLFHRGSTELPSSDPAIRWIKGSITEEFLPGGLLPDIIIHGASPGNRRSIRSRPMDIVDTNILATRYLLECAGKHGAQLLFFSSAEVYPRNRGPIPETEASVLAEQSTQLTLYGSCKLAGELLCEQYLCQRQVRCQVVRLFSIYGPGEDLMSGRCFPDFLRQTMENRRITVTGPGTQMRSFCYLSDFVSGLLYVLLKGEDTVYNVGNEDNTSSILGLAHQMAVLSGNCEVVGPLVQSSAQVDSLVPDTTRLRTLGWVPKVSLEECIRRCLESCTGIGRESK